MSSLKESRSKSGASILHISSAENEPGQNSLFEEIKRGLIADLSQDPADDRAFQHSKYIPTVVLYDDQGLEIYKEIEVLPEYYLFEAEFGLLKQYGPEISKAICRPSSVHKTGRAAPKVNGIHKQEKQHDSPRSPNSIRMSDKWGNYESGSHNYGVNGNFGLSNTSSPTYLVELGAGSCHKTATLLGFLAEEAGKTKVPCTYLAVDLEQEQLAVTLDKLLQEQPHSVSVDSKAGPSQVEVKGVWASYDDVRPKLSSIVPAGSPKCLLWLGSSIGNFTRSEARDFLTSFVQEAMNIGDTFLIGVDCTNDKDQVELAYGDPKNVTARFILNGLDHVKRIFENNGEPTDIFDQSNYTYLHRFNTKEGCHEAYYKAKRNLKQVLSDGTTFDIAEGENILVERSYKYTSAELETLLKGAGLRPVHSWRGDVFDYRLILCEKPAFVFPSTSLISGPEINHFGIPSLDDWHAVWKLFDTVTLQMIPKDLLYTKPIDLRHICLFYIGHIPTFLQIHLSRALDEPYTEPAYYTQIFERGIDPNIDNPSVCHKHSIVPEKQEDWPALAEILDYRDRVRARLTAVYESGRLGERNKIDRRLARAIAMVFEHEALHAETLLYMLMQISEKTLSPAGFSQPDWTVLARQWDRQIKMDGSKRKDCVSFGPSRVELGQEDHDTEDLSTPFEKAHRFGWDNENGIRTVEVEPFEISLLTISNAEYHDYLKSTAFPDAYVPSSWIKVGAEYGIRTFFGPGYVSFAVGQYWPCQASGKQLAAYAAWKGGRLPTEPELRLFHNKHPIDTASANVGFKNWHPVPPQLPVLNGDGQLSGCHNGGVWEWTSSNFETYQGFSPSILYPGYSSDFFDETHSVMLGGSWATIPRIAGRNTMRNWYQTGYPYVFAGARVVYDA